MAFLKGLTQHLLDGGEGSRNEIQGDRKAYKLHRWSSMQYNCKKPVVEVSHAEQDAAHTGKINYILIQPQGKWH